MIHAVRGRFTKDREGAVCAHQRGNHVHPMSCIHLKRHVHRHSSLSAESSLMQSLNVLQRSRLLRDPSMDPSLWNSPPPEKVKEARTLNRGRRSLGIKHHREVRRLPGSSTTVANQSKSKVAPVESIRERDFAAELDQVGGTRKENKISHQGGGKRPSRYIHDLGVLRELASRTREGRGKNISHEWNPGKNLKVLSERFKEISTDGEDMKSSQFHRHGDLSGLERVKRRKSRSTGKGRELIGSSGFGGKSDLPSSPLVQGSACPIHQQEGRVEEYDPDTPEASQARRNGCGIPWNWSRIHHRGRAFLDMSGQSFSHGLSDSKVRRAKDHVPQGQKDVSDRHAVSYFLSSSLASDSEEVPLPTEKLGSQERTRRPDNLMRSGDLDLDSDVISGSRYNSRGHYHERHQSLTEKYAPRTFEDLAGQHLVVQALSNAVLRRKVGFLYVFYGPSGTGKTSCARIFARSLNCQSLPHTKPCGICDSCIAHDLGEGQNVLEVSPVSKFDSQRIMNLLNSMNMSKLQSQYRVLIVDDCDTLPLETWGAISKVIDLAHGVVFILVCTTVDRLPHTILSRCQKFFFQKVKDADIIYTLQWVATKEGVKIDEDALKLITSRSGGSLRDAEMTLDQLSLLGRRISLPLVRELVGLASNEKLVGLLDSALSADTVNTVKSIREIMEVGVEPMELISQLATIITDILVGSYVFTVERLQGRFFHQTTLSRKHTEKLRQALKRLSEAEKQLRTSNDRVTCLTAALLQLAPDQQYILPSSSVDTSSTHSPVTQVKSSDRGVYVGGDAVEGPNYGKDLSTSTRTENHNNMNAVDGHVNSNHAGRKKHDSMTPPQTSAVSSDITKASRGKILVKGDIQIDEIWLAVLEHIQLNSLRQFLHQEGKLISVTSGAVQLIFSSHVNKSKAENFMGDIWQAFKSVLGSPVTIEMIHEPGKDVMADDQVPSVLTDSENRSVPKIAVTEPAAKKNLTNIGSVNLIKKVSKDGVANEVGSIQARHLHFDPCETSKSEIVEIGTSGEGHKLSEYVDDIIQPRGKHSGTVLAEAAAAASHNHSTICSLQEMSKIGEPPQIQSLVRRKVTLRQLLQQAEECAQQNGLIVPKAVLIAKKVEQENLRLEPRSRRLCCWKVSTTPQRKLPRLRIRTRRPHVLLKLVPSARCICTKSSS